VLFGSLDMNEFPWEVMKANRSGDQSVGFFLADGMLGMLRFVSVTDY
jgi:hypothetical protein